MLKFKFTLSFIALFTFLLSSSIYAADIIKIGVLAKRGALAATKKWGEHAKYLNKKTGLTIKIIPLKFIAIETAVKTKTIDYLLANSSFYVGMEKKYGAKAIATLINSRKGKALKSFGGVLFVRKDSPIKTMKDVKGKKFMLVKRSSFGGGHMVWRLLKDNGIDIDKDTTVLEGKKHDNVVLAIKFGRADVGTVRSDTLERMQDEGKIKLSDFRIINPKKDDFPFVRSTQLYPEWPLAALKGVNAGITAKIIKALTSMKASDLVAKKAKIIGWTNPLDYGPVRDCLKTIKYGPFK